jgi:hypothetical protein
LSEIDGNGPNLAGSVGVEQRYPLIGE